MRNSTILAVVAVLSLARPVGAQVIYTIRDVGFHSPLGQEFNSPTGINNLGQVTGNFRNSSGNLHAFRTAPGGTITDPGADLGVLSGGLVSHGFAINATGQVAGRAYTSSGSPRAFRTSATGFVSNAGTNPGLPSGASDSQGLGINDTGQVIGYSSFSSGVSRAFRTTPTGLASDPGVDLGNFGGSSTIPNGINNSGQVTGQSGLTGNTATHAFRTTATGTLSDPASDLGTLGGNFSSGYGINASGQVVGFSRTPSGQNHAFRTTANGRVSDPGADLGTLPGMASSVSYGINALEIVVGNSGNRAFVFDTQMHDLNDLIAPGSGWVLTIGRGINDLGQITGLGTFNGEMHVFVLTPIPEPSTLALGGVAFIGGWMARRRYARHRVSNALPGDNRSTGCPPQTR